MERRNVPDSEQKLVILYALERLGTITSMQLLQFLVEEDLMNYFVMQLNLCELEEQGQVEEQPHPFGMLLRVTEDGAYALETFLNRIPASRREQIDAVAETWRRLFRTEQQTLAESFPLSDGGLCVRLRLLEDSMALVDMLLTLPGVSSIAMLPRKWRDGAQIVYDALTRSLGSGYAPDAPLTMLPPETSLQQINASHWLLMLTGGYADMQATVMLTLPNEHISHYYASGWPEHAADILRTIFEVVTAKIEG